MFHIESYRERREALREKIKSGIIIILGNQEAPMNYPSNCYKFIQDSNFLYFFGIDEPNLVGIIDVDAMTDCIYGNEVQIDDIIWMGNRPTIKSCAEAVGVASTASLTTLQRTVEMAIKGGRKIHFTPPYRGEQTLQLEKLLGIHSSAIASHSSTELTRAIISLREIKSNEEIAEISKACDTGYLMQTKVMEMCHTPNTEVQIAAAIEAIALSRGKGVAFHNIVSQHGEVLHNHSHKNILETGKLLLVDAGAMTKSGYCSDFTRTTPVGGRFSPIQRDIYTILTTAFEAAIDFIKPQVAYKDVHIKACTVLTEGLIDMGLMKGDAAEAVASGAHALFMPHGIGHQLGLDVHDMEGLGETFVGYDQEIERSKQFGLAYLRMGKKLQKGHVMTVEPGIYFIPALFERWNKEMINRSFINYDKVEKLLTFGGCRVEDNVVVTQNGTSILGKRRIPYTASQIEDYMAQFK